MTRRQWIGVLGGFSGVMTIMLSVQALGELRSRQLPLWMTETSRWYEQAMGALMYAIVAGACVVYLLRTKGLEPWHVRGLAARPAPWRKKVELRVVLYCLATGLILQLPLGIVAAVRAAHDNPPPWSRNFISLFPAGGWIFPLVGIAIIIYDRRRLQKGSFVSARILSHLRIQSNGQCQRSMPRMRRACCSETGGDHMKMICIVVALIQLFMCASCGTTTRTSSAQAQARVQLSDAAIKGDQSPTSAPASARSHYDTAARRLLEQCESGEQKPGERVRYDASGDVVYLMLSGPLATEENVKIATQFSKLRQLRLRCSFDQISSHAVAQLGKLDALTDLELYGFTSPISDDFAEAFAHGVSLRSLRIAYNKTSPHSIQAIGSIPSLRELAIVDDRQLGDAVISSASSALVRVERLDLSNTGITNGCLESLSKMPNLKQLTVWNTAVTKEGVDHSSLRGKVRVVGFSARD